MRRSAGGAACKHAVQQLDKLRRGAAAAAGGKQVQLTVGLHLHGVQLRGDVVAAAVGTGQTGIGLDEHRVIAGHGLRQPLCHGVDLLWAERTVDADGICAKSACGGGKALDGAAGKGASACLKAHACQNGQGAVLLCGKQSCLKLVQVGKGLKKDEVGAGVHTGTHDACILAYGVLKGKGAAWLKQLAQRAYIQCGKRTVGCGGTLAVCNAGGDDLLGGVGAVCQLVRRCAKRIGVQNKAARSGIRCVDALQHGRVGNVQLLRLCAQLQPGCLQHGAHTAVQQDGIALLKKFTHLHRFSPSFYIHSGCSGRNVRTPPDVPLQGGR